MKQSLSTTNSRPTHAVIDLAAISHNLREIKKRVASAQIMAVVKANAYGHGFKEVTKIAIENGATYLGVALVEEGIILRKNKFTIPVLVFGGFFENQIEDFLRYDLDLTVYDRHHTDTLNHYAKAAGKKAKVQIKVDTGMGRVGVAWQEAAEFVQRIQELKHIEIVGIYTHFATSDEKDKTFAETQLSRFRQVLKSLKENHIQIPLVHAANSGAILDLPNSYFNMVRPGVSMYGYYP